MQQIKKYEKTLKADVIRPRRNENYAIVSTSAKGVSLIHYWKKDYDFISWNPVEHRYQFLNLRPH